MNQLLRDLKVAGQPVSLGKTRPRTLFYNKYIHSINWTVPYSYCLRLCLNGTPSAPAKHADYLDSQEATVNRIIKREQTELFKPSWSLLNEKWIKHWIRNGYSAAAIANGFAELRIIHEAAYQALLQQKATGSRISISYRNIIVYCNEVDWVQNLVLADYTPVVVNSVVNVLPQGTLFVKTSKHKYRAYLNEVRPLSADYAKTFLMLLNTNAEVKPSQSLTWALTNQIRSDSRNYWVKPYYYIDFNSDRDLGFLILSFPKLIRTVVELVNKT